MSRKIPLVPKSDCETCGETHVRCHGHRSSDGKPCMCWPPDGSNMCVQRHGQSAPQNKAAIVRRVDKAELVLTMKKWDLEAVEDEHPALTLSREKRRLQARMEHLDSVVNVDGYEEEYRDKLGVRRPTPLMEAYREEGKQLAALARDMARLGLDAEALQLERTRPLREQAQAVLAAVQAAAADPEVAMTPAQQQAFGVAVRKALTASS